MILDKAGSKGTGKWTVQQAAHLAVPCATHAAALEARNMSARKEERTKAAQMLNDTASAGMAMPPGWQRDLEDALLASKLCSYAQGMAHLSSVSEERGWSLQLSDLAEIW
jgi:6-phosphogluconate dehydrogenase